MNDKGNETPLHVVGNTGEQNQQEILGPDGQVADSEKVLLGADGKAVRPELSDEERDLINKDIEAMLQDKAIKHYGNVMLLGSQLYSWAENYIMAHDKYKPQARMAIVDAVNSFSIDPAGNPIPFDERVMAKVMTDEIEFVKKEVKAHLKENNKRLAEIEALAERIMSSQPKEEEPKEGEENNE